MHEDAERDSQDDGARPPAEHCAGAREEQHGDQAVRIGPRRPGAQDVATEIARQVVDVDRDRRQQRGCREGDADPHREVGEQDERRRDMRRPVERPEHEDRESQLLQDDMQDEHPHGCEDHRLTNEHDAGVAAPGLARAAVVIALTPTVEVVAPRGRLALMPNRILLLSTLLIAVLVAGCGGDDDEAGVTVRSATLQQVLRDPEAWDQGPPVTIRGSAYPREGGFLLVDSGSSIWVAAPEGTQAIRSGDRIAIRGEVERLAQDDADAAARAVRGRTGPALGTAVAEAVRQTPTDVGEPFIVLRRLIATNLPPAGAATEGPADDEEIHEIARVQERLEAAGLMLLASGGGSDLEEEIDEPLLAARRYEITPSSREFELLIFPSRELLRRALEDLMESDLLLDQAYELAVGANVLAAFPPPTGDFRGYRIVRRVLADLE